MRTQPTNELIATLRGTTCICGTPKGSGQSFCRACYHALTRPQKAALYRRITAGYADAYADARKQLEQVGRIAQDARRSTTSEPRGGAGLGTTSGGGFG